MKTKEMKTKPLTFLLALTFLFLFSGSSVVFADDYQDGLDAYQKQDYKTAHKFWLSLAEQGDEIAQSSLGVMYAKGKGVPQDYKESLKWYRLAAEQGEATAQHALGWMYTSGIGVPQDHKEAARLYRLAAKQEHELGQFALGLMYANGKGVPQNYKEATKWQHTY
jgi:TPR repeat protein